MPTIVVGAGAGAGAGAGGAGAGDKCLSLSLVVIGSDHCTWRGHGRSISGWRFLRAGGPKKKASLGRSETVNPETVISDL